MKIVYVVDSDHCEEEEKEVVLVVVVVDWRERITCS